MSKLRRRAGEPAEEIGAVVEFPGVESQSAYPFPNDESLHTPRPQRAIGRVRYFLHGLFADEEKVQKIVGVSVRQDSVESVKLRFSHHCR